MIGLRILMIGLLIALFALVAFGIGGILGHACEMETSAAMVLAPEVVKHDALAAGELTELAQTFRSTLQRYGVSVPYRFDRYTSNGALGDARKASHAYGEALMSSALTNFVAFIDEVIARSPIAAAENDR